MMSGLRIGNMSEKKVFFIEEHLDCNSVDLYNEYTHIRAYHACRPLDIQKYLSEGIQVLSRKQTLNEALARIHSSYVSEADIKRKFNANWKDSESEVFLNINKQELLTASSHYLIYGSEFLNRLAMELGCRGNLKETGIPTIFYCDIPIEDINPSIIFEIERKVKSGYVDDITITVAEVLPCDIVNYEHPLQRLQDYHVGGAYRANYEALKSNGFSSPKIK